MKLEKYFFHICFVAINYVLIIILQFNNNTEKMNFKGIIPRFQTDAILKYFQKTSEIEEQLLQEL